MNEEQKNIETCLPENILAEVASVPTDPQFRSLVNESLDPLKQQAADQTGWDAYVKVAGTHKPYTFTSSVRQMKSNLILLLRRLWRFPFGRGTIRSLSDMWQHYITRLKGNPEYGIPSRLDQLTDLPAAPALLADRKIGGVPEAPDGISLVQLIGSDFAITAINDTNKGWTMTKRLPFYKNLHSITIGCKEIVGPVDTIRESLFYCTGEFRADELEYCMTKYNDVDLLNGGSGETLTLPKLHTFGAGTYGSMIVNSDYRRIVLPALKTFYINNRYYNSEALVRKSSVEILECPVLYGCASSNAKDVNLIADNPNLRYVDLRGFTKKNINIVRNCPQLETLILGKITEWSDPDKGDAAYHEFEKEENLIHLEFGEGSAANIKLPYWSPTLDNSNLQQFLSNFRDYIANRLTDKGSGLTLTLSQEVRNAIHAAENEYGIENIIITQKGWTISPAPN